MKEFKRQYPLFSVCGLNCGLCSMHLDGYCPGCGGGLGNQPCAIARCSKEQGDIEFCYMCDQYPCEKYDGIDKYDSFITHRNQLDNLERANDIGLEAYQVELEEKIDILKYLLKNYNDGRKKSFFCISVNLLELEDIKSVIEQVELEIKENELTLKEKSKLIEIGFKNIASKHGIELKLNKKPKSKK